MLGEFPGYAWHVRWTPGEDFLVLTEEFDERAFLCRGKASRHHRRLGGVCRVHLVRPCVVGRIELHLGRSLLAQGKDVVVCVAIVRACEAPADGDRALRSWHLQLEVSVVWHRHEPGEPGSS